MNTLNQEADMGYVRDFVAKVAEALVTATELPKQIKAIKAELVTLNSDLDHTKQRNIELDTALNDTRRQRDEAEQALSQVKSELASTKYNLDEANRSLVNSQGGMEKLMAELDQVKKDRDDYGMKQMEAEERATAAEAKLAKLAEALGLPKPQPVPEPAKYYQDVAKEATAKVEELTKPALSQSTPQSVPEPFTDTSLEAALPEPTPPKRVYKGDYNYYEQSKGKTEKWDSDQYRYYVEI